MYPTPDPERLSTRSLLVFLAVGLVMLAVSLVDLDDSRSLLLVGAVVAASNGVVLVRRWSRRSR